MTQFIDLYDGIVSLIFSFLPFRPDYLLVSKEFKRLYQRSIREYGAIAEIHFTLLFEYSDHKGSHHCGEQICTYHKKIRSVTIATRRFYTYVDLIVHGIMETVTELEDYFSHERYIRCIDRRESRPQIEYEHRRLIDSLVPYVGEGCEGMGCAYVCDKCELSEESQEHGLDRHEIRHDVQYEL